MSDNQKELSPEMELANAKERILELEQDIRCFAFVNYEMMQLFGLSIDEVMNKELKMSKVMKAIKNRMLEAMSDEEGFSVLFSHFADDAMYVGLKYKDLAVELSEKKLSK